MLGFSAKDWLANPSFWTTKIVHPDDSADAVAFCALATGQKADHIFEYRAITKNQDIIWLRDYVRVILGPRKIPVTLRGLMIDVSEEKWAERAAQRTTHAAQGHRSLLRLPTVEELEASVQ